MTEDVADEAQEPALVERRERGPLARAQRDDGRRHARWWPERARRHSADDPRVGERFDEHGQVATLAWRTLVRRGRDDAARDLLLHEHDHERRPARVADEALEQRRRDLVRQVRDDPGRTPLGLRVEVHGERIGAHDAHVVSFAEGVAQHGDHPLVDLDRRDRPRTIGERRGENAGARPDLEHVVIRRQLRCVDDRREHTAVHEEVLPEALRGARAVAAQRGVK